MYYDHYVRREAVRLVVEEKMSLAEVSRRFDIRGHSTLSKWIAKMKKSCNTPSAPLVPVSRSEPSGDKAVIADLEKRLAQK